MSVIKIFILKRPILGGIYNKVKLVLRFFNFKNSPKSSPSADGEDLKVECQNQFGYSITGILNDLTE